MRTSLELLKKMPARKMMLDEKGATMVEYAILVSFIAAATAAVIVTFGVSLLGLYTSVASAVAAAV